MGLEGCGFQLRESEEASTITALNFLSPDPYSETVKYLKNILLERNISLNLEAPYSLVLSNESQTKNAITYKYDPILVEYDLCSAVNIEILDRNSNSLLKDRMEVHRKYLENQRNFTTSEKEKENIYSEMYYRLAQKIADSLKYFTQN